MSWQDRLRDLGERLASGEITTDDYRRLSEGILAEADAEKAAGTAAGPATGKATVSATETADETQPVDRPKVHIPKSAAWEAPSGEMTQIVGTKDETTVVDGGIAEKLGEQG